MSWYKRAQNSVYDLDNNYLSVGHSGYNNGEYGCNHLWYFFNNGLLRNIPETERINNHGTWRTEGEIENGVLYKGRVDTCKKVASLTPCSDCYLSGNTPMNYAKEAFCERMKHMCIDKIHQKFGQDIRIQEF